MPYKIFNISWGVIKLTCKYLIQFVKENWVSIVFLTCIPLRPASPGLPAIPGAPLAPGNPGGPVNPCGPGLPFSPG